MEFLHMLVNDTANVARNKEEVNPFGLVDIRALFGYFSLSGNLSIPKREPRLTAHER
jgi:hypothetical protein